MTIDRLSNDPRSAGAIITEAEDDGHLVIAAFWIDSLRYLDPTAQDDGPVQLECFVAAGCPPALLEGIARECLAIANRLRQ